jgi:tetratricopeptide (TPR) repeat protein
MGDAYTNRDAQRHNELYLEACKLIEGEIQLGSKLREKPGWLIRRRLQKAANIFRQVLEIKPSNWAAMWLLGKIFQRLGDDETALDWFTKACLFEPDDPNVPREAALCALNLGRNKEALDFAANAVRQNPQDAGLHANLAIALLLTGEPTEAHREAEWAVQSDPDDRISKKVLKIIDEVNAGERPYPKHFRELK